MLLLIIITTLVELLLEYGLPQNIWLQHHHNIELQLKVVVDLMLSI